MTSAIARLALALAVPAAAAHAADFGNPVQCTLGTDCFVQQLPDMAAGPDAVDPFCGIATYDGHTGVDIRVLSMADVARGVPVVAMAEGRVLRMRDGEPDALIATPEQRAAVEGRACGNGVLIEHADGVEVQYCHMRRGSLAVKPGQAVARGDRIGEVGASGLAAFPHLHLTVRKAGQPVDPLTGRALADGCAADPAAVVPLFTAEVAEALGRGESELLGAGLAGEPVDHAGLAVGGPPAPADSASAATVGWAWFANLRQGDRIRLRLSGPGGATIAERTTEPTDRTKAAYSAFAGRKGAPAKGDYELLVELLRDGQSVIERRIRQNVR